MKVQHSCRHCGRAFVDYASKHREYCSGKCRAARPPLRQRFDVSYEPVTESGCWLWTGTMGGNGYGRIGDAGRSLQAHRVSYQLLVGEIAPGLSVLHRCDTPCCVNPSHLSLGEPVANSADMVAKQRQARGTAVHGAKLNPAQIQEIRARYDSGNYASLKSLGADYGVSADAIHSIVHRQSWRHVA